ncbi:MAG: prolyl-tRNA synthetase associated domain-containing protein [Clostridia bacterium]|nr:prolyl-tRNA synthetase associated domain-containing protein [Clostridia bacterium]MBQ3077519.1 prolyl-tRNA synthetase associated domain-containing protein [Clostridia bacterium]
MFDRAAVLALLDGHGFCYEMNEHEAVYTMAGFSQLDILHPEADAKNLFLRDSKKRAYYLLTVRGDQRVDLKALRAQLGSRPLHFASEEDLMALLGLTPGAVSPFGLLNDGERRVRFLLDSSFVRQEGALIGLHPNDNRATVWMRVADLLTVLREHGTEILPVELGESPA